MELALSLGDAPKPFSFLHEPPKMEAGSNGAGLGFCMGHNHRTSAATNGSDPPVQLDLLPFTPVLRRPVSAAPHHQLMSFSWLTQNLAAAAASEPRGGRRLEVKRRSLMEEGGTALSSPNSTASSFQMEFSMQINSGKRYLEPNDERGASSRASDDDENGMARKKLRLTKEQSAFLEESFKEHNTLNPKQKVALAKQLNLRPRQVEVWFQNRRARTKLKQTEVDCEHLKRCCETLTDENRRLQKELQELRALKSSQPFYMQSPATTLTMCPSCERIATTTSATPAPSAATNTTLCLAKPREHLPFPTSKAYQGTTAS